MAGTESSSTRGWILDAARELFIDQGYDGTSLREISERLGFTKAALYYHFQSKEELLAALLEPGTELIGELVERLEAADGMAEWGDALEWVIGLLDQHLDLFRLVERNRAAIEASGLTSFASIAEHQHMHERIEKAVLSKGDDLPTQVRMFAALGAVTGFDDWAPKLLFDTPPEQLVPELSQVVRDILGPSGPRDDRGTQR